jgi:hypothetical protein
VEHDMQVRPGIDAVPPTPVLGHRLLHPLWLWFSLFRHRSPLLSAAGIIARLRRRCSQTERMEAYNLVSAI